MLCPNVKTAPADQGAGQKGNKPEAGTVDSQILLRGGKCVDIEHRGERYVLRETRGGKLILTK